jgi:peroxiredoxin
LNKVCTLVDHGRWREKGKQTMIRHTLLSAMLIVLILPGALVAQSDRTQIHASADQAQPLLPGMKAPAFQVRDARGESVTFDPDTMGKPLIITFFRGGWCPYCNLHLAELRHAEQELKALGFDLWFISTDRPELLYKSLDDPDIGYTVLSDANLDATRVFGVAFRVDDETFRRYQGYGVDLEEVSGESHHVLPVPATFLVGSDGVIHFQYSNPDYKVRLHPDVLLAAARVYTHDEDQRLIRARDKSR